MYYTTIIILSIGAKYAYNKHNHNLGPVLKLVYPEYMSTDMMRIFYIK